MTELRISSLIDAADELLDNKFHVGSYCLFMNTDDIQDILSKIRAILPEEIKTAENILKRRDDIYQEAQSKANRIINEAQNTAANILSESELIRAVREKAAKIQEQVKESCEDMKNKAEEESDTIRRTAYKEAMQTREGAQAYAEEVLTNLERNIDQIHRIVRNGQDFLAQQKNRPQRQSESSPEKTYAGQ
ncbi:MAG: hypothetical protein LUG16_04320 [Candidatus Gastranaerophilales bacterium]|nr:hypothetical protein [Candidatus Gastranaerophilales bacterium]